METSASSLSKTIFSILVSHGSNRFTSAPKVAAFVFWAIRLRPHSAKLGAKNQTSEITKIALKKAPLTHAAGEF